MIFRFCLDNQVITINNKIMIGSSLPPGKESGARLSIVRPLKIGSAGAFLMKERKV